MNKKTYCHFCGSRLTEKFVEGRDRLFCTDCNLPIYENAVPATAAAVFNAEGDVLLVKRAAEPKAGQWCLPGGFLELEESPEAGCLRELREETGLEGRIRGWVGNESGKSPTYGYVLVMGYVVDSVSGELVAGDDGEEARYFPLNDMPTIAFRSHRQIFANALAGRITPIYAPLDEHSVDLSDTGCFGAYVITAGNHVKIAQQACEGGARVVQYRDKKATRGQMLETARHIRNITRQKGVLLIVNDYIDIALAVGADGVHLGQDDIPIEEARKMVPPGFIIGLSTHSLEQAVDAEKRGADYIGSGPVFATPTKEHYIPIGMDVLEKVLKTVKIPVVAIGGLNLDNLALVQKRGAKNVAMVRAFQVDTAQVVNNINHSLK